MVFLGNLGLEIMIGPSQVCAGRGMYIAVAADDGVGRVEGGLARQCFAALPCLRDREDYCADCSPRLPVDAGTLISGYSKAGKWRDNWQGDKTVAFAFDSPDTPVVFEKQLMPLIEAMSIADGVRLCSRLLGGVPPPSLYSSFLVRPARPHACGLLSHARRGESTLSTARAEGREHFIYREGQGARARESVGRIPDLALD